MKLPLLLGTVCACLVNVAQAASLSSATFDWNSFTVTAGATDITNSIVWNYQADFIDTRYIEGAVTGSPVETLHDIDPNAGWATSQQLNDGGIATDAKTSVTPGSVSASTEVNYTGRAESSVSRFGIFTAPVAGLYAFSVPYALTAEVNPTNSETGGPANSLVANNFFELDIREGPSFLNPDRFGFVFDGSVDVSGGFGTKSNSGIITVDRENANAQLFNFVAGDTIYVTATATTVSTSYSSMLPPVPVPAAIYLFLSGLGALLALGRNKRSAV